MTILGLFLNQTMRTGANRRYLELMEDLASRGNRVFVVMNASLEYRSRNFTRIDLDVPYRRKGFPTASFLFNRAVQKNAEHIRDAVRDGGGPSVDWIHIHGDTHLDAAVSLKKRFGARLFYAFRCNDVTRERILRMIRPFSFGGSLHSLLYQSMNLARERLVSRRADLVTFQNSRDRDEFLARTGYDVLKTVIIPGNIGPPRCLPEWEGKNTAKSAERLVYVGILALSKGLGILLEALSLLKSRGRSGLHLTVLGKIADNDPIFARTASLGIADMVTFAGYALPFPYLAENGLMVFPTLYDAFPDTVLEALHTGCPVIASRVGGLGELLAHDELLFESGNVDEIAARVERCLDDPAFYAQVRKLCAERKQAFLFDWSERFELAMKA